MGAQEKKAITKVFSIREYEYFYRKKEAVDASEKYHPLDDDVFETLEKLIRSHDETVGGIDAPDKFMSLGYSRRYGDTIKAKGYAGVIGLKDGTAIEILPKIDTLAHHEAQCVDSSNERDLLLKMLGALANIDLRQSGRAKVDLRRVSIFEAFIGMFLGELSELVRKGLRSDYVAVEENCGVLNGKLLFNMHVRTNAAHAERFYVSHDEYSTDRAENRVIRETLRFLKGVSSNSDNIRKIQQLMGAFVDVPYPKSVERDLDACSIDRNTTDYKTVLRWCGIFLSGRSATMFKTGNGDSEVAVALLFPMSRLFEAYVAQCLRHPERIDSPQEGAFRAGRRPGLRILTQDTGKKLFEEPARVNLRPDIVCNFGGETIVLDTKWKRVSEFRHIAQGDWYQMYAYGHKYEADKVVLVYPANKELNLGEQVEWRVREKPSASGVSVSIFAFDLARPKESTKGVYHLIAGLN